MLDLRPVAALPEQVQLRARDQLEQALAGRGRDDLVLATMDQQRLVGQRADVRVAAGHRVDPALARCREHAGKRLLEAGPDAGLVAQSREVVIDQLAVEGKNVEQRAHVLDRGRVAPRGLEPRCDRETDADAAHQREALDTVRRADRQRQRQRAAEGVADQVGLLEPERVHHAERVLDPAVHGVADVGRPFGVAKAHHVGRDDAKALGQHRHRQAPVGPGGDAGAGAVDQEHRLAAADVVVVGVDAGGADAAAEFGVDGCVHRGGLATKG